jgi:hypothetical protein
MTNLNSHETSAPRIIQELPWPRAIQAIKESLHFDDIDTFRADLQENLPYNSASTRRRHKQTITQYFFPDRSLETIPRRVWRVYRDDQLLEYVMRYQYLTQEPTVAQFVVTHLASMAPGSILERQVLERFIQEVDPKNRPKMIQRLGETIRRLGFVVRERRQDVVVQLYPPKTALLTLLHYIFAPTPRIVTLSDILADPFWKYLGFRQADVIRRILHEANAQDLIASYAAIDQLEQITTCYSLSEWFDQRLQL